MKLFTKICLCVCLACVCIGTLCLGVGVALGSGVKEVMDLADGGRLNVGNWNVGRWYLYFSDDEEVKPAETQEGIVEEYFLQDEVESLDIDIKYGRVFLLDSDTDQIEISIDAPKRNRYECKKEDGELELKDKTESRFWKSGAKYGDVEVTIRIPEGKSFHKVELTTNAGAVAISHNLVAEEIELEVDAGELTADDVTAEEELTLNVGAGRISVAQFWTESLDAECGMGDLSLGGTILKRAEAKCGMGKIELRLSGREEEFDYKIDCGLGNVSLNGDDSFAAGLSTEKTINNEAGKKVSLECGMGEINVITEE